MSAITDIVDKTLEDWNSECARVGTPFRFEIRAGIRTKKYHITKDNIVEKDIAELLLLNTKVDPNDLKEVNLLLYRKELNLYAKQKHETKVQRDNLFREALYHCLIYEMLGNFCISTKQLIKTQDYCEYDLDNDRLRQHESAVDMTIKTLIAGPFFEIGDSFDVFMDTEGEYYAVYTDHEYGIKNNGIARIPKADCLITNAAKKQIILL